MKFPMNIVVVAEEKLFSSRTLQTTSREISVGVSVCMYVRVCLSACVFECVCGGGGWEVGHLRGAMSEVTVKH